MEIVTNKSSRKRRIAAFLIDHFVFAFLAVIMVISIMGPGFIDNNDFK